MSQRRTLDFRAVVLPFIALTLIWGSTWIVIRGQISTVAPQWSVAYRFIIAAAAMFLIAAVRRQSLAIRRDQIGIVLIIGVAQFSINFNAVYIAEQYITSGVVATMFALLLIPASLLGWAILGQRPDRRFILGSLVAIAGIGLLLSHEMNAGDSTPREILIGSAITLFGMTGAALSNVVQARPQIHQFPLLALLAWSMAMGAAVDVVIAVAVAGWPMVDPSPFYWAGLLYLALVASALTFILYYPLVRRIGPARAAYSSMLVPIIAMGFSTWLENYRWTGTTISGAILALGGMGIALSRNRSKVAAPMPPER